MGLEEAQEGCLIGYRCVLPGGAAGDALSAVPRDGFLEHARDGQSSALQDRQRNRPALTPSSSFSDRVPAAPATPPPQHSTLLQTPSCRPIRTARLTWRRARTILNTSRGHDGLRTSTPCYAPIKQDAVLRWPWLHASCAPHGGDREHMCGLWTGPRQQTGRPTERGTGRTGPATGPRVAHAQRRGW